ncbi:MAG: ribosome-binding factor [Patescibacteria group bacterium]|nr:ribosome-binding factor [Patescibacteria group bacterium]
MSVRHERIIEILHDMAARFLLLEGNNSSLLTITNVVLTKDGKRATIFFTVFPESYEKTALEFAKRKRSEFKQFVRDNSRLGMIPQLVFAIDAGEKNRQRIDNLLNES